MIMKFEDKNETDEKRLTAEDIDNIKHSDVSLYDVMNSNIDLSFAEVIFALTHREYSENEAHKMWAEIRQHNAYLERELGRDPGVIVSALDYLYNVRKEISHPTIMEKDKADDLEEKAKGDG